MDDKKSADLESQTRIQSLVKEKDELLDLAMTRGKIIQVNIQVVTNRWKIIQVNVQVVTNRRKIIQVNVHSGSDK